MPVNAGSGSGTAWLRKRRRLLVVTSIILLALIPVFGRHYVSAQTAQDAEAFRSLFGQSARWHYIIAACIDLLFAASYGLLAIAVGWPASFAGNASKVRGVATLLVVVGALMDGLENVMMIVIIVTRRTASDAWIDTMRLFGRLKWSFVAVGLLVLALCAFASWAAGSGSQIRAWWTISRRRYGLYLVAVFGMVGVVPFASRALPDELAVLLAAVFAVGLALLGSWLNRAVNKDRSANPGLSRARVVLGTGQLAVGVVLVVFAADNTSYIAGILFFFGLALVVMSLGSYVSELRMTTPFRPYRGPVLIAVAGALLLGGTFVGTWPLFVGLVLAGLVVGELGTELASADLRGAALPTSGWNVLLIGGFVAVVGTSLLIVAGADPLHAFGLLAVFVVLAAMASAGGDGLVVVLVLAIVLVWATSPNPLPQDRESRIVADEPYFAVLGDSYISGEGAEEFIRGTNEVRHGERDPGDDYLNECRQAPTAWPFLVAEQARMGSEPVSGIPSRVLFLACSGAVTENIDTERRLDEHDDQQGPAELAILQRNIERRKRDDSDHPNPEFVLLSIGGNDAGFGDLGQACIGPGNCAEVAEQFLHTRIPSRPEPPGGQPEALADIGDDLDRAYERVKSVVGTTPVVVASYPMPIDAAGRCSGVLFDSDERVFIRGFVEQLNLQVKTAAQRAGFIYMDLADALTARQAQLCSSVPGAAGLNFLALNSKGGSVKDSLLPSSWIHNSIHPNATGHQALARAAENWFGTYWPDDAAAPQAAPHQVADTEIVLRGLTVTQCDPATRPTCNVNDSRWLKEQAHDAYNAALLPLALIMLGLWLAMAPIFQLAAKKNWSLLGLLAEVRNGLPAAWRWLNGSG